MNNKLHTSSTDDYICVPAEVFQLLFWGVPMADGDCGIHAEATVVLHVTVQHHSNRHTNILGTTHYHCVATERWNFKSERIGLLKQMKTCGNEIQCFSSIVRPYYPY